jgi:glutathione synthase/RimK-type ligase-like ATP-grasp enzyme
LSTKVLILSSEDDVHAETVKQHLTEMNVPVDYFRYEDFVEHSKISYRPGGFDGDCLIERAKGTLDLHSYSAIWHRRPGQIVAGKLPERWIQQMVEQESRNALDGMFHHLRCLWVNHPRRDYECLQKLWQLHVAAEVGLVIPKTLVTNQPKLVEQFFEECDGQVIYKLISELSNFAIPAYETPRGISTLPLRKEDLAHLDQVMLSPHFFQQCIPKSYDLRVTIVGQKIFCIKIDSQAGEGKLDWRHDYSVAMDSFDLPDEIAEQCLALMRKLQLNYGAIDFVLSPDNKYYFLEINCAGQYMWIEQRCEMPISLELAKLLAGVAPPLVSSV